VENINKRKKKKKRETKIRSWGFVLPNLHTFLTVEVILRYGAQNQKQKTKTRPALFPKNIFGPKPPHSREKKHKTPTRFWDRWGEPTLFEKMKGWGLGNK